MNNIAQIFLYLEFVNPKNERLMIKQILFAISLLLTLGIFAWTIKRIFSYMKFTKAYPIGDYGKRFMIMMKVAIGQTKIFRRPVIGFFHAIVFWGFLVILIGSIEMLIDGLFGTERVLSVMGIVYDILFASGDIFAFLILIFIYRKKLSRLT